MSDKRVKSKLRRKKFSAEELRADPLRRPPRELSDRLNTVEVTSHQSCRKITAECPAVSTERWWDGANQNEVERLWASSLRSFFAPCLEEVDWGCVPNLPPPSSSPVTEEQREWRWCCLDEEVLPITQPHTARSLPRTLPTDASHLRPECEDTAFLPTPARRPALSSPSRSSRSSPQTSSCHLPSGGEDPTRGRGWRNRPEKSASWRWMGAGRRGGLESLVGADRPGSSSAGARAQGRGAAEREENAAAVAGVSLERAPSESDVIKRQLPALRGDGSDRRATAGGSSAWGEGGGVGRGMEGRAEAGAGAEEAAAAAVALECCPMCLMPFPAGYTQMDCDEHLAQCLSEMNEDVVW